MAEYTGAQEAIPLGKKATKERERLRREGIVSLINDAEEEDDEDDEGLEWEMAQSIHPLTRGEFAIPHCLEQFA